MLRLSQKKFDHELDLVRFIKRQRTASVGIISLLKSHQTRLVDKLSELVIASSNSGSDPFDSVASLSDDSKSNFWTKGTKKLLKGNDRVDQNLLHLFRFKKGLV